MVGRIGRRSDSTGPNVLLVEDGVLLRLLVSEYLSESGFCITDVADADEALDVLKAGFPIDVVFTDLHMPRGKVDGLGLARWIRLHRPELKVILASGIMCDASPTFEPLHYGPILRKPYDNGELERQLWAAITERATPPRASL